MSVRGVLIRIDSTDSLCEATEMISPKSPNLLKSDYFSGSIRGNFCKVNHQRYLKKKCLFYVSIGIVCMLLMYCIYCIVLYVLYILIHIYL